MYCDEIESVISEYLKNSKEEYAVMIDGDWGSGKTYFLTHSLMKIIKNIDIKEDKRRKCAYVSLYGAKSIDEVSKEIVFQYFGKENNKKVRIIDTVMETASNILTSSLGAFKIDLSKIKKILSKIDINNWIICFDDLERCCISLNEILGFINRLVEHNKCKVIVLANEKEIGKLSLNQRLEEKYQVVLMGRRLLLGKEENSNKNDAYEGIDIKSLQKEIKTLFNEDILYKSIREKVIGLTIKYEPKMDDVFDSILLDYNGNEKFQKYMKKNKEKILKYFEGEECFNLRTLIFAFGSIQKVYDEMILHKYDALKYFDRIMEDFLMYIVLFTIYYRNGGKVRDLKLSEEMGYVPLGQSIFSHIKGFRFLEKYCTTLSFSEQKFLNVVSILQQEYEKEDKKIAKSKIGLAKAYEALVRWWEKEDDDVEKLINQLKEEIEQDKYSFNSYQEIISLLIVLEYNQHAVGDLNALIDKMNQNIENSDEIVNINRYSYTFKNNPTLQKKYEEYVDKLKLKADYKNQLIKSTEVSQCLASDNWANELFEYCDLHYNDFLLRYGFIDLLDISKVLEKLKNSSTKELYLVKDIFKTVYRASNINEYFFNDKDKIKKFREAVAQIDFSGINKPMAKNELENYLDDIINRLEKEDNF